jgi:hypothetical protein
MKKLVLSLLGAATLATASNAMAINTANVYKVFITTGGIQQTFAGAAFFDFDSENFNTTPIAATLPPVAGPLPSMVFPGSCVYSLQWIDQSLALLGGAGAAIVGGGQFMPATTPGPLALSAQSFVAEQMSHGLGSCVLNAMRQVPSLVTLAGVPYCTPTGMGVCTGFDQFAQIDSIQTLSLGETAVFAPLVPALSGVVQFGSALGSSSVFAISFLP